MSTFTLVGIIGIVFVVAFFFTRIPVAYAMAIVGFLGYWYLINLNAALSLISTEMYGVFSSSSLALVPLFIFMGFIAFYAGISSKLYDTAYRIMGSMKGGLAMATVVACTAFGAICGSTTATAATMGAIGIPEMQRYNYGNRITSGSVAAGGGIGILMPPSVVLIIYGILTQLSIGELFIAGIIPAFLLMFLFILAIILYCLKNPLEVTKGEKFSIKQKMYAMLEIWETLFVFFLVMGSFSRIFHAHQGRWSRCWFTAYNCPASGKTFL